MLYETNYFESTNNVNNNNGTDLVNSSNESSNCSTATVKKLTPAAKKIKLKKGATNGYPQIKLEIVDEPSSSSSSVSSRSSSSSSSSNGEDDSGPSSPATETYNYPSNANNQNQTSILMSNDGLTNGAYAEGVGAASYNGVEYYSNVEGESNYQAYQQYYHHHGHGHHHHHHLAYHEHEHGHPYVGQAQLYEHTYGQYSQYGEGYSQLGGYSYAQQQPQLDVNNNTNNQTEVCANSVQYPPGNYYPADNNAGYYPRDAGLNPDYSDYYSTTYAGGYFNQNTNNNNNSNAPAATTTTSLDQSNCSHYQNTNNDLSLLQQTNEYTDSMLSRSTTTSKLVNNMSLLSSDEDDDDDDEDDDENILTTSSSASNSSTVSSVAPVVAVTKAGKGAANPSTRKYNRSMKFHAEQQQQHGGYGSTVAAYGDYQQYSGSSTGSSSSSKRKRKRVLNRLQRAEATMREKRRMLKLNKAFEELRKVLPISEFAKNKLSRAETLKSAIEYIEKMSQLLTI